MTKLFGLESVTAKMVYKRLATKPVKHGYRHTITCRDTGYTFKEVVNITHIISNNAIIFYTGKYGFYDSNEYIFVKGYGLFPINESNIDAGSGERFDKIMEILPMEYHQYLNRKQK